MLAAEAFVLKKGGGKRRARRLELGGYLGDNDSRVNLDSLPAYLTVGAKWLLGDWHSPKQKLQRHVPCCRVPHLLLIGARFDGRKVLSDRRLVVGQPTSASRCLLFI